MMNAELRMSKERLSRTFSPSFQCPMINAQHPIIKAVTFLALHHRTLDIGYSTLKDVNRNVE